jgi:PAS domain S-box-containing protein
MTYARIFQTVSYVGENRMKIVKTVIIPLILIAVCGLLLRSAYVEVKSGIIDQLNSRQFVMAETAARGIENFFKHYSEILTQFSTMNEIASLDESGRQLMQVLYRTHLNEIKAITRISPSGRLIYAFPEISVAMGADFSSQEPVQTIMRTRQPVISEVFDSTPGSFTIAFQVPVFKDEVFQGSLGVLIPFDQLSRDYIEPIKTGKNGYAWMISQNGTELYCPVPGHMGHSVFDNCRDFPTILSMAREMVKGNRGTTTYFLDRVRGETVVPLRKQAVYVPVNLGNTFWSIVVATPEDEVLGNIQGFRDLCFLLVGVLVLIAIAWTSYTLWIFKILKETGKRERAEAALRETHEVLQAIIAASPVAIMSVDREGRVMNWSPAAERIFGWSEQEVIGRFNPLVPEDKIDAFNANLTQTIDGKRYSNEVRARRKDGSLIDTSKSTAPLRNTNGEIIGAVGILDDITERNLTVDALRESEARFRTLVERIPEAITYIHALDENRSLLYVSPQVEAILGYPALQFMQDPQIWYDSIHPDDYENTMTQIEVSETSGQVFNLEYRVVRKDGQSAWLHDVCTLVRDENGRPSSLLGVAFDITGRRQMEEALRESEAKYRSIFENAMEGIYQSTPEGRYLSANPALARMSGFSSPEEMIEQITDIGRQMWVNPEDRERMKKLLDKDGRVEGFETQLCRRDGRAFWVTLNARTVRDATGSILYYEGTCQDITDRKQAEESLKQAEERYRSIFENATEGIFRTLPDGRIIMANPAFARMCGYDSPAELMEDVHDAVNQVLANPELAGEFLRKLQDYDSAVFEAEMRRKDGSTVWASNSVRAIRDAHGEIRHFESIIEDITERKQMEEALRQSEQNYRDIFNATNDALFIHDASGRILDVNERMCTMFECDRDEALRISLNDISLGVSPYSDAEGFEKVRLAIEEGPQVFEWQSRRLGGELFWSEVALRAYGIGEETRIIASVRDINERKLAEDELHKYAFIVGATPDLMSFLDKSYVYQAVNDAYLRAHKRTRDEIIGHSVAELHGTEVFNAVIKPEIDRCLAGEQTRYQAWFDYAGIGRRYVDVAYHPYRDRGGAISGMVVSVHDITERKQMEETLWESEHKFHSIFDSMSEMVVLHELTRGPNGLPIDYRIIECNPAFTRSTGIPAERAVGILASKLYGTDEPPYLEAYADVVHTGKPAEFEVYFEPMKRHFAVSAVALEKGRFATVTTDITERKRAENALKESELKYRELVDFLPISVIELDKRGTITAANRAALKAFRYSDEELRNGINAFDAIIPEDRDRAVDGLLKILDGEAPRSIEYTVMRRDGSTFPVLIFSNSVIRDCRVVGIRAAVIDISDRKRAEDALVSEQERLASILDGIPVPTFVIDAARQVVLWNRYNEAYTGMPKSSMLGRPLDLSPLFREEASPSLAELLLEWNDDDLVVRFKERGLRKSEVIPHAFESVGRIWIKGEERTLAIQAARVFDSRGRVVGIVQTGQDITERMNLEARLIQSQKLEAVGTLAGGIAHHFNSLLGAVMGRLELALGELHRPPRAHKHLDEAMRATVRAAEISRLMLTYLGQTVQKREPCNLVETVREALLLVGPSLPREVHVNAELPSEAMVIQGDKVHIAQALTNLILNSGEAIGDTGGRITVAVQTISAEELRELRLFPSGWGPREDSYVSISISDTGCGFNPATMERIFDPFFSTKFTGRGLGLAVVLGIVRAHEGALAVESRCGQGSTFRVFFPLSVRQ